MMKWFVSDQPASKSNYKTRKNAPPTPLETAVRGQREASPQVKRSLEELLFTEALLMVQADSSDINRLRRQSAQVKTVKANI